MSAAITRTIWSRRLWAEASLAITSRPAASGGGLSVVARAQQRGRLRDQLGKDLGGRLLLRDQPDRLPRHQRAPLDIALDHRPARRAGPEMLDLELGLALRQRTGVEPPDHGPLLGQEAFGGVVGERAHRNHGEE